jgi:hypothetical protein
MEQLRAEHEKKQLLNLYGVRLFLSGEYSPESVEDYIATQEKTHIAEGLRLRQRTTRYLDYTDGHVRGFGTTPMVHINQAGYEQAKHDYETGDEQAWCIMRRRQHDVMISQQYDILMSDGEVGDTMMAVSPYEEELDDKAADRLGFWSKYRRSYVWLFRKVSSNQLECTDLSIDRSSLATYKELLRTNFGRDIPDNIATHDIPSYVLRFSGLDDQSHRRLIDQLIDSYAKLNKDPEATSAKDKFEAVDFLDQHAADNLKLVVDVHKAIAESMSRGQLHELVRLSANRALQVLDCLSNDETVALSDLVSSAYVSARHDFAFSTLIAAQRYGVWNNMNNLIRTTLEGSQQAHHPSYISRSAEGQLDDIYRGTNQAAAKFETMPGCVGGTSFLQQNPEEVHSAIFEASESYGFTKKMFCLNCQAPPKHYEQPKWCGPCGICRICDSKLRRSTAGKRE